MTALYDVTLVDDVVSPNPMLEVRLRAKPPGVDAAAIQTNAAFHQRAIATSFQSSEHSLQRAFVMARFAESLRDSPLAATFDELTELARDVGMTRKSDKEVLELLKRARHTVSQP